MDSLTTRDRLREAVEYAPASGPVAPDLRGVWTPDGWFVCARCVGRLYGRGCGHLIHDARQMWADTPGSVGVCCTCSEVH
jgi:hypothetical protein